MQILSIIYDRIKYFYEGQSYCNLNFKKALKLLMYKNI